MTSQAWPAGRRGNNASGIDEDVHVAFLDTVFEDLLSCRNDDSSYIIMYFFAFEDPGSQCHVFQTTVGAGADNDLLDRYVAYLVDSLRVFRGKETVGFSWDRSMSYVATYSASSSGVKTFHSPCALPVI